MSLGQVRVEVEGPLDGTAGPSESGLRPIVSVPVQRGMGDRQTGMSAGEVRIQLDGSFVHLHRDLEVLLFEPTVEVITAPQIVVVGLQVVCRHLVRIRLRLRRQRGLQGGGDLPRHVPLDREDVSGGQLAIVAFRPEVLVRLRVDQLRRDPDLTARPLHASFQNRGDAQLLRDLPDVLGRVPVLHHRRSGGDLEIDELGQVLDDGVVHAVGEVTVIRLGAHVGQG